MRTTRLVGIDLAYVISLLGTMAFGLFIVIGDRLIYLSHDHYFPFLDIFPALFLFLNGLTTTLTLRDRRISSTKLFSFTSKKGSILLIIGLLLSPLWPVNIFVCAGVFYMFAPFVARYSTPILVVLGVLIGLAAIATLNFGVLSFVKYSTIELSGSGIKDFLGFFLFNGYFSILPWAAFFLAGLVIGRSHLQMKSLLGPSNMIAFILIFSGYFLQKLTADYYINREILPVEGNIFLLNYKMYLPGFILYATGICFLFINLCIYALNNVENKKYMNLLNAISGAKYSIYTWHLVLGIITRKIFTSESFSNKYLLLAYILMNMYFSVWAILQWKKKVTDLGPIEWIMKRLSSSVRN
jgi:hypothetical protein